MQVEIQLTRQRIGVSRFRSSGLLAEQGAEVEFCGLVRGQENGMAIAALEYEAYSPMAEREMRRIIEDIGRRHRCLLVRVIHRIGVVPVGEAAICVDIAARHRAEAFAMLAEFMDRLKQDVPIWKRQPLTADALAELKAK
ncbi:MAG TPA: molybdenum cofactor biosynthesis protein MoaE [Verrucomicrobiae bacterium]